MISLRSFYSQQRALKTVLGPVQKKSAVKLNKSLKGDNNASVSVMNCVLTGK